MKALLSLLAGLLFGAGLILSGMTSPDRVMGFLDVAGHWDPSLAFVMAGAVMVATPLFMLANRKARLAACAADAPETDIDARLLGGAALFGIGWGLAGICPGPALVNVAIAPGLALPFAGAMMVGLLLTRARPSA
jgi:uncharacterized membrane protein YedE/YeeE